MGLKKELENKPDAIGVFLETAHPIKFSDTVEEILSLTIPIPEQIKNVLDKEKKSLKISSYEDLKAFLLS
ncbi:hypothetical protein D9M72_637160 [compost metagenome]